MSWLKNIVRPKIRALVGSTPKEVPDNLWEKCPDCNAMLFKRELEEQLNICRHCGFHLRMDAEKRLDLLFDQGEYTKASLPAVVVDPLKFRDQERYTGRIKRAQQKTGKQDAVIVAEVKMGGIRSVVAMLDFSFMGGSMGAAVGEGLVAASRMAVENGSPLIVVTASGGARMQEGMISLMQMPRSVIAASEVKEAGLPYIVVFTDPTTGGVTASFAMLGDVHIAEKGAQICFAGPRVIENTIRETLPEGFQRAEYLLEHGMVDIVVNRKELRDTLIRVISLLMNKKVSKKSNSVLTGPVPHGAPRSAASRK